MLPLESLDLASCTALALGSEYTTLGSPFGWSATWMTNDNNMAAHGGGEPPWSSCIVEDSGRLWYQGEKDNQPSGWIQCDEVPRTDFDNQFCYCE